MGSCAICNRLKKDIAEVERCLRTVVGLEGQNGLNAGVFQERLKALKSDLARHHGSRDCEQLSRN